MPASPFAKPRAATRRAALAALFGALCLAAPASAEDAEVIDIKVRKALEQLFATVPGSQDLYAKAKGALVMPDIIKGGFVVGGAYGEGALLVADATAGYYSFGAASFGFQAGVQSTKQALFFMTDAALDGFRDAKGWSIGADAEVTFPGDGVNLGLDSTTARSPIVAFIFGEDGLMAGASIEGGKYTRVER
ncbi:YSC84-related protein [Rubrimonas cliftonensis]|uniref:Lipid-binding SYLF domain-containing protein n=1 Tax=Rubrimonas cliftonensis TaxID=89524 RepID=A0A1H4BBF4_9RHOB|nr:YSC84-related protein [Rubrimonas cliftonensis]SEA45461.1 Lipid-binding SYLF domain-containing protein [Rubrimonas cliftonensis]